MAAAAWAGAAGFGLGAAAPEIPKERVKLHVQAEPEVAAPGEEIAVSIRLKPLAGIKLNRYPKIRVQTEPVPGVAAASETTLGNAAPPPPEAMETNYFGPEPEPLRLQLRLEANARPGRYEIPARVRYFYCVTASGFCAPAEESFSIPVTVR